MSNRTNLKTLLPISVFLLAMVGTAFAEPLFPLHVGLRWEFNRQDNIGNEWTVYMEVDHQQTFDSLTYFHLQRLNYENDGALEDMDYFRSTEQAVYWYNPSGTDYVVHQAAPIGTKWHYPLEQGDYIVREIVAIEAVTVPYGTFDDAYQQKVYTCLNPGDLGQGKSTDWYEWVVPGVGFVKQVNDWVGNPPATMELVDVIIPADIDINPDTLNLQSKGKWITCYIRLPEGYDVADIDTESILLKGEVANGGVTPKRCRVHKAKKKAKKMLIVRFYRSEVQAIVEPGEVELTVSGELTDGTKFEGTDTITVIDKGGKK